MVKTIKIILEPVFEAHEVRSIRGQTILVDSPTILAGSTIVGLFTKHGRVPTQCYENLAAKDESGALNLSWEDTGTRQNIRQWKADRDTNGLITLSWHAFPRQVTSKTMAGARSDMRFDQGGIEFAGLSTIPVPWANTMPVEEMYRKVIEWNLSQAIPGTRAVSSYGEGPESLEKTGKLMDLLSLFFMVGPIRSYPAIEETDKHPYFGYYWFGDDTPEKITSLGLFLAGTFQQMSAFFQDPASESNGYRIFVRCASPAQAHGGAGAERSFMLEYNDSLPTISSESVLYLLSHEMVHNWPLLDSEPFSSAPKDLCAWFNEGVADYYGSTLPYRFSLISQSSYLKQMNSILCAYYTNSSRDITDKDSLEGKWENSDAMDIPYKRGFTYLCTLNAEIQRRNPSRSLDDLVIEIFQRKKRGDAYDLATFLGMIEQAAPDMLPLFHEMQAGKLIVPPADALGSGYELVMVPQEVFELGFAEKGLTERKVMGLAERGRAKEAGLQEGDEIIKNTFLWQCRGDLEQKMTLQIRRDGAELEIVYWPRSFAKVESWQFREKVVG